MTPELIKIYRLLLRMSSANAAQRFGVAQRTWQSYESGERNIPASIAVAVCAAVHADRDVIVALLNDAEKIVQRTKYTN